VSAALLHPEAFGVAVIRRPPFPAAPGEITMPLGVPWRAVA